MLTNNYYKIQNILFLLLILSLPFEKILTFDLYNFTVKPPYIIGIVFALFLIFNGKFFSKRKKIIDFFLFLFIFSSFLTLLWSISKFNTAMISFMFLFVGSIYLLVKEMDFKDGLGRYLKIFVWMGVALSLFGIWQFFGDMLGLSQSYTFLSDIYIKDSGFQFTRIQSTFFEPGFFANFLIIPIFLSAYFSSTESSKTYYVTFGINLIAFFFTLSRGGFLALAITAVIFLVLILIKYRKLFKKILLLFLIGIASFLFVLMSIYFTTNTKSMERYLNQSTNTNDVLNYNEKNSKINVTRSYTVKVALQNSLKHPFGVGTGSFGSLPEFKKIREMGNTRQTVNSMYPEILVEQGALGLFSFVAFAFLLIYYLFKDAISSNHLISLFLGSALMAMLFQFSSFSTLYLIYFWVFAGLSINQVSKNHTV